MRLEMNGDKYRAEYKAGYPQTQTKGKVEIIETYLKPKHGGKAPILVAGDSSGDANMLTEYKDTKVLLLMKREGKLDDVAKDGRALIQKRNAQTGLLDPKN
jgi:phosphoserine phosphatase